MIRLTTGIALALATAGCSGRSLDTAAASFAGEARSADGVPIRYEVHGSGEPTLILIHGWTNSRAIWGEHPRTLARSHRVVAVDLAGHGASGSSRERWTMDAFGEDVVAVANQLRLDSIVLVGFSMGGAAALEAAERMPRRTVGVVLVDAFHDPERVPPPEAVDGMLAAFRTSWGDTAFFRAFAFTPDAPDSLIRHLAEISPNEPREHWFLIARELFAWARTDFAATLRGLDVPVGAINATRQPTNLEAIRRLAPGFVLDTLQGVGHAGMLLQRVPDFDRRLVAMVRGFARQGR